MHIRILIGSYFLEGQDILQQNRNKLCLFRMGTVPCMTVYKFLQTGTLSDTWTETKLNNSKVS